MSDMSALQCWNDVAADEKSSSVSKKTLAGRSVSLVRVEIKAGAVAKRHSHPFEQFVQILAGGGLLETAEGEARFAAGSVFHFPAEAWHAASFDEDTILVETNLHA